MLVLATGGATQFGGIAAALADSEPPSALERGVHQLGLLIMRITIFLVLFVLLVHLAFGRPVFESFLFAVALAVGLTPELLPMIMTVTLSRGALRMAAKSVIVKRLAAIHDLGAMDVLCTDKTGTLTQAHITLVGHPDISSNDNERVLTLAAVNSRFSTGIRSPLDQAVADHSKDHDLQDWVRLDEVPFDFGRRSVSVLAEHAGSTLLIVKGAPESILGRVTQVEFGNGTKPLNAPTRETLDRIQQQQGELGNRLLAVAWKPMPSDCRNAGSEDERDLIFAGFCVFLDPPKESAAVAIERLERLGVRVKVISGDHEAVVRHVGAKLGIHGQSLLTGTEISELSDPALVVHVEHTNLFARVSPDQKTRIIRALQTHAHTVGFIGDGVNDAPAIRTAEVGISVEGATDVARAAADMIMLSPDLGVLADGVEEGRRTFANILKYVRMGTSSNFGNMLSMALASLVLAFLPLLPIQILLNNLLYDLSEIGIPFDQVDSQDVREPRIWDMRQILRFTFVMGTLSSVFDVAIFAILRLLFDAGPDLFRTAWFVESTATQILVIFVIRTYRPSWSSKPHWILVTSSLAALAMALAIVVSPLAANFHFLTLPPAVWLVIATLVLAYLLTAEFMKRFAAAPRENSNVGRGQPTDTALPRR
jgi:Mg2+-importing ATPase